MRKHGRSMQAVLALAVAAVVVGGPGAAPAQADWRQSARALERALQEGDAAALKRAIRGVAAEETSRSVQTLITAAVNARELNVYDDLVAALSGMTDPQAVRMIARQTGSNRDWTARYLLVDVSARIADDQTRQAVLEAFSDRQAEVAAHAMAAAAREMLDGAIPALIERLEEVERRPRGLERVREAANSALRELTGERFTDARDWSGWWRVHEDSFDPRAVDRSEGAGSDHTVLRRVAERGDQNFVEELGSGDIFCITGQADRVQDVLSHLELPHTVIERRDLAERVQEIPPTAVIIFNCAGGRDELSAETVQRLTRLVEQGAYVFTSDWELRFTLERITPGYISVGQETDQREVSIRLARGAEDHPYMRDVMPSNPYQVPRWQIDGRSFTVQPGRNVTTLVESDELGQAFGSPIVACTFRHGRGAVVHVLGHFMKQQDESGDGYALQQLLVNFIVEKQRFRAQQRGRGGRGR